jgi:hypothetical protein
MPERWTTESPARTTRLRMSISISPSRIAGMIGWVIPHARREMTIERARSSSGEKGMVSVKNFFQPVDEGQVGGEPTGD